MAVATLARVLSFDAAGTAILFNPSTVRSASCQGGLVDATTRSVACQVLEETMFTRSCSEVKVRAVAVLTCTLDVRNSQAID